MGKSPPPIIIGLTGNTGSGKSTVAGYLKSLGAHVIDADLVAKEAVLPGTETLASIVATFGGLIANADGTLNRKVLGDLVFGDRTALSRLNEIIHPAIIDNIAERIREIKRKAPDKDDHQVVVIDAPLLIETNLHSIVDQIWVVAADCEARLQRIVNRDKLNKKQALQRITSQLSQDEKIKVADRVIQNNESLADTFLQVDRYWRELNINLPDGDESPCPQRKD